MASVGSAQVGFACPKFPGRVRRYHWGFDDSAKATTHMSLHTYRVEFFETASQIPNGLWDACFQPPAEGRWWYETLDQSGIEDQFTFFYGLIKHLNRPVGIAPGFVMDLPVEQVAPQEFLRLLRFVGKIVPSVLCQRTVFVGSPVLDEGRVGLLSHVNRRTALLALQVALEKKADELRAPLIVWKDFPESSSADLNWLSHERRLFRVISFPNTIVEFPSHREDDYFAVMKGSRRRNLKKKLSLSREHVALGVEIVQRPDAKTLDDIFKLFWQTYEKSATKFETLNRKFFEVIAEKPATIFIILREKTTGEMIAFMLCFALGERLINMFIGMDYSRPKEWMLFFRLWEAVVDLALSRGFSAIVSGRSSYEAKIEMGHKLVPLNNYCRHRNIFLHSIYQIFAQTIHWASMDEALARFLKAHPRRRRGLDYSGHVGGQPTRPAPHVQGRWKRPAILRWQSDSRETRVELDLELPDRLTLAEAHRHSETLEAAIAALRSARTRKSRNQSYDSS